MWTHVVATPTEIVWLLNTGGDSYGSARYCVRLFDLTSRRNVTWNLKGIDKLFSLDTSPDGTRVVAGGEVSKFKWDRPSDGIWEWSLDSPGGDMEHPSFTKIAEPQGQVSWARFAPNGALVVVCEEMNPPSKENGDLGYRGNCTGNRFVTVWDRPRRYLLS
jgi:hypothetical protein